MPWLCRQSDPVNCLCVYWGVRSATCYVDTQAANRIWLPTQPRHYTTREKIPLSRQHLKMGTRWPETCWATYKEQLTRRNKFNTKWHLVGFLFHIDTYITLPQVFKICWNCKYIVFSSRFVLADVRSIGVYHFYSLINSIPNIMGMSRSKMVNVSRAHIH